MYLSRFHLYGYKSFLDSGDIELTPGFNILTGKNNAGKTALLEALSLRFQNKPHRSLSTVPMYGASPTHRSQALFQIVITPEELHQLLPTTLGSHIVFPIPYAQIPRHADYKKVWEQLLQFKELRVDVACAGAEQPNMQAHLVMPYDVFTDKVNRNEHHFLFVRRGAGGKLEMGQVPPNSPHPTFNVALGVEFAAKIYAFRAERLNIGVSAFGSEHNLHPDARNLPEVLHVLQSTNPARFERYNSLVKRVLPQVEWITTRPVGSKSVEIVVWAISPKTERSDLAIPLTESGTGISQVLAMLYVLATADRPKTIIIDEPNSFLHPGAVRVLVEILREHPSHQYIVTTHAPELISASNPSTVHIIRREHEASRVESVDTHKARNLRALLLEVGSRFSDVFGAESVLWVEGPTEQMCFPLIVRQRLKRALAGISIVGVLHTGDFDAKRDTRTIFRIYERLTQQGNALLPPAIAFVFDRELRPEKDLQDLERESKGADGVPRIHFLGRRTYENYLIHAGAIAAVLNSNPPFSDAPTHMEKVQAWLDNHINDAKYYGKEKQHRYPQNIDAPRLLKDLFSELSENRLDYNKVEHSLALTEWLLENAPEELKELVELLAKVLPAPQ